MLEGGARAVHSRPSLPCIVEEYMNPLSFSMGSDYETFSGCFVPIGEQTLLTPTGAKGWLGFSSAAGFLGRSSLPCPAKFCRVMSTLPPLELCCLSVEIGLSLRLPHDATPPTFYVALTVNGML